MTREPKKKALYLVSVVSELEHTSNPLVNLVETQLLQAVIFTQARRRWSADMQKCRDKCAENVNEVVTTEMLLTRTHTHTKRKLYTSKPCCYDHDHTESRKSHENQCEMRKLRSVSASFVDTTFIISLHRNIPYLRKKWYRYMNCLRCSRTSMWMRPAEQNIWKRRKKTGRLLAHAEGRFRCRKRGMQ
jgi:hypothetical protein